jgi:hypothetical protein
MGSNRNYAEITRQRGVVPAVISVSNSGETVHAHVDREVMSRLAVILHGQGDEIWFGLGDLRDALDRVLLKSAQPPSVSNRRSIPEGPHA